MSVNSREPALPGGSSLSSGHGHQRGRQYGGAMPSTPPGCREYRAGGARPPWFTRLSG